MYVWCVCVSVCVSACVCVIRTDMSDLYIGSSLLLLLLLSRFSRVRLCATPMDCSLPGFSVHGILQARTLGWVAISFSNA